MTHNLEHVINGCTCDQRDITHCVICGRKLPAPPRKRTDTCGAMCRGALLRCQRDANAIREAIAP